jgi:hypothetical protein
VSFDLNNCSQDCFDCIHSYKKKHRLTGVEENPFQISCSGIPKRYVSEDLYSILPEEQVKTAEIMLNPVAWAREVLDWHCLDPDGEVWKRKNPAEYHKWIKEHPGENILGHSRYHRPYQAVMLSCTSQYKAFRIGRRSGKTETLVVSILYNMFVKPGISKDEGFKVIVITPYQEQIDGIFKRINQLVRSSAEVSNSVVRYVKSPSYRLELNNGSEVKGLTAGTKSGGNAASVRGSDAHQLCFDETDFLNSADLAAALAVTIDHPDASVWMSSTPRGTRDHFYDNCNSPLYKEFHFPSYVNPMWNEKTEAFFRNQYTELVYKQEICADWGEQEEGVFQNTYVEAAQSDYSYGDLIRNPNWRYMIGVDWNDVRIGTSIAVIGYDPAVQCFYLMDKQKVSRDKWNQTAACHKIAQINQFWQPEYIYVDSGGPNSGGTQVELLQQYGWQIFQSEGAGHPNSRLKNIVKAYSFGGTVEIHDLITKQPIKKPAKPFLVENTVRKFEHGVFKYPKSDEHFTKQLLGYVIDRVTIAGVPVYKAMDEVVGDHDLDAVMLALVAFTLETTDFGKPKFSIDFAFSGKIGEKKDIPEEELSGWVIVKNDKKVDPRSKHRPELNRTEGLESEKKPLFSSSQGLPAKNTTQDRDGIKLWTWPGWSRDAPKPAGSLSKSTHGVSVRTARPTRKNI